MCRRIVSITKRQKIRRKEKQAASSKLAKIVKTRAATGPYLRDYVNKGVEEGSVLKRMGIYCRLGPGAYSAF